MLYAHGSDLCHELELRHAMANCFEALMGALLLDGGIGVADKVFAHSLFLEDAALKGVFIRDFFRHCSASIKANNNNIIFDCNRFGSIIHHTLYKNKSHWAIENGLTSIQC